MKSFTLTEPLPNPFVAINEFQFNCRQLYENTSHSSQPVSFLLTLSRLTQTWDLEKGAETAPLERGRSSWPEQLVDVAWTVGKWVVKDGRHRRRRLLHVDRDTGEGRRVRGKVYWDRSDSVLP
jgi:hypothetical protein